MKYRAVIAILIVATALTLFSQVDLPEYYMYSDLSFTSQGVLRFGLC